MALQYIHLIHSKKLPPNIFGYPNIFGDYFLQCNNKPFIILYKTKAKMQILAIIRNLSRASENLTEKATTIINELYLKVTLI